MLTQFDEHSRFCNIATRSIWNDVYPPWLEFIRNRIHSQHIKKRFSFIFRSFLATSVKRKDKQKLMDYILVYAEKPSDLS